MASVPVNDSHMSLEDVQKIIFYPSSNINKKSSEKSLSEY